MTTKMTLRGGRFELVLGRESEALKAARPFCQEEDCTDIHSALASLGWVLTGLDGILFGGGWVGQDDELFCAIAPFVEAGSHIDMIDEDYGGWRWYFDGRWLYKFSGFTVYPCCPPLLAAPPDDRVHSSLRPTPLAAARDAEEAFWQVASRVLRQAPPLADQVFRRQCMAAVSRWAEAARAERAACERSNPSEAG